VLPAQPKRRGAGGKHLDGWAGRQQPGDELGNPDQEMLAIVQQHERLPRSPITNHHIIRGLIRRRHEPDCPGHRVADERRINQRRQIDPDHAIGEEIRDIARNRERQPRFADATGTGQGQQRDGFIEQKSPTHRAIRFATDQPRARSRRSTMRRCFSQFRHCRCSM
jgi:hypothetical protein